jgi:adenylate cyclase
VKFACIKIHGMSRATKLKLSQLGIIIVAWMILGFIISSYDRLVLMGGLYVGGTPRYTFALTAALNVGAGLTGALLGGTFLVFFVNVKYQDKPYGYTILAVSISFILIILLITIIIAMILAPSLTPASIWETIYSSIPRTLKNILVWTFIVAVTQLLLQINSKFGQGAFWNIIRGKYNTPKQENRIFMFLDLNSSTTIAESIGDENYHALLKDFFADITKPILDNKGEIYQYVGDEVVVAWKYEHGIENQHCLKCFFDLKLHIDEIKEKYLQRYGIIPTFKAGMHCGRIVAGEVGIIKRDITYSGDVLNTTSRILNKCVEFDEELIASSDLLSTVLNGNGYIARPLGAIKLRGKERELLLNALAKT